jgi:hypothetical protein
MTTYTNPFTGQTISPSSVSYEAITLSGNLVLQWPINGNTNTPVSSIIDVAATANGFNLILPPAQQVSTGQTILIRNVSSNSYTFTVAANSGTTNPGPTIINIASGAAQFIWLTDNTTTAGTWATVLLGAGTSSANASALAGYGLSASGLTLNENNPVTTIYSSYQITATSQAQFLNWNTGVGTLTLPSASAVGNGWFCIIGNNGSGIVTITPVGTDTINGNSNQQLQLTESLVIVSNGTGWSTYGYGRSNSFAYTQLALTVTGGTTTLTSAQAANTIQQYNGTLMSNQIIVVPSTVQLYSFTNSTSGSYTLTVKTSGGGFSTLAIPQGQSLIAICDGSNVINANSGALSSVTSLTLSSGSVGSPSINYIGDLTTGIYHPTSSQIGISLGGSNAATFTSTGLLIPVGISGGTF